MIEVEAKIKVPENRIDEARKRAGKLGKFAGIEIKKDDYYTLESPGRYPEKSLRIRKGKRIIVNFKKRLSYLKGVHAKRETEFDIGDIGSFLNLIRDFGFRKWLHKEKRCEIYEIEKNFHIEINHVKGLGWFIEIEHLAEPKEIQKARANVLKIIKMMGFNEKNCIKQGYTKQLWDKMH